MNLVEAVIGAGVDLKSTGSGRLRGLCPLHNERTPSFFVFDDQQRWWCFGCGEGGDAIDLVRRLQNCGYREALRILGRDDPKVTAATIRAMRHRQAEKAAAEWRERDLAWTLANAIRIGHQALKRITPETFDDLAAIHSWLSIIGHHHEILVHGDAAERAAVVAEYSSIRLFPRNLLFRRDFNYRAWLGGVSMEPQQNARRRGGAASYPTRTAAAAS